MLNIKTLIYIIKIQNINNEIISKNELFKSKIDPKKH